MAASSYLESTTKDGSTSSRWVLLALASIVGITALGSSPLTGTLAWTTGSTTHQPVRLTLPTNGERNLLSASQRFFHADDSFASHRSSMPLSHEAQVNSNPASKPFLWTPFMWLWPISCAALAFLMTYWFRSVNGSSAHRLTCNGANQPQWNSAALLGHSFGFLQWPFRSRQMVASPRFALGGEGYEERYDDVELYLMHFLTYKALRFVLHDLAEKDEAETEYQWLYKFMSTHTSVATDSEQFLKELASERPDLAVRVSDMRLQVFAEWMKKYDQLSLYERIKASNLTVMRHQLYQTVILEGGERASNDS